MSHTKRTCFGGALISGGWGGVKGWAESLILDQLKSHSFLGVILAEEISMTYSSMLYELDISMFYFYESLLFQIFITCFKYYTEWNQFFFIKIHMKVFIFVLIMYCFICIDLNVKHRFIFLNKNHDLQKKHFTEKNMKKLLNYILYTHDVTRNLSRWNNGGNDIYKKETNKN